MKQVARAVVALIAGGLLLSGCGGGDDSSSAKAKEPAAPTSATATATPSESATPDAPATPTATVQQYASVIARNQKLGQQLKKMDQCDWAFAGPLDEPGSVTCALGVLTLNLQASTLRTSLTNARTPSAGGYVGEPPAEVAPLVKETTKAARRLERGAQALVDNKCAQKGEGRCLTLRVQTMLQVNDMQSALDGWDPYL